MQQKQVFLSPQEKNSPAPLHLKGKAQKTGHKLYLKKKGKYLLPTERNFYFLFKQLSTKFLLQVLIQSNMASNKIILIEENFKKYI